MQNVFNIRREYLLTVFYFWHRAREEALSCHNGCAGQSLTGMQVHSITNEAPAILEHAPLKLLEVEIKVIPTCYIDDILNQINEASETTASIP